MSFGHKPRSFPLPDPYQIREVKRQRLAHFFTLLFVFMLLTALFPAALLEPAWFSASDLSDRPRATASVLLFAFLFGYAAGLARLGYLAAAARDVGVSRLTCIGLPALAVAIGVGVAYYAGYVFEYGALLWTFGCVALAAAFWCIGPNTNRRAGSQSSNF